MTQHSGNEGASAPNLAVPQITISFLYSEDCPSHERALQMVRDVLREEGIDAAVSVYQVETEEEAETLRFPGSPTIRVNGVDIVDDPGLGVGLSCRAYRQPDGRISPLPPRDSIVYAFRQAARFPQMADTGRVQSQ